VSHRYNHIVTVTPADMDVNRHASNIVYVRWVQEAAIAHWNAAVPAGLAAACSWVVLRHEIDYKKAAFLGDVLQVCTWVASMDALTSERCCEITRPVDGALLARVRTRWCAISPETGRPRRIDSRVPRCFGLGVLAGGA
jgi:acyl-CoA thioester hydrolase